MSSLDQLLERPESKTLEYKRDASSPEGILRAVVAFANTSGGTLVVGVEDRTRRVVGVKDILMHEERMASIVSDSIKPRLAPEIDIVPWRKTHVLVVTVHASGSRPHHLIRQGPEAGVYVRIGSTNRRADPAQIDEMRRYSVAGTFDEQPISEVGSEELDFTLASELFAPVRKLHRGDLLTLRAVAQHQSRMVATVGGYLLFGKNRFDRFPDAYVKAGRFGGKDRTRILDTREIRAPLLRSAAEAEEFLRMHMVREASIDGLRRVDKWMVPPVAFREAIMNAIIHADYSERGTPIRVSLFDDRIEVESPGILPPGMTIESMIGGTSKLRNRVIARVFEALGMAERWGSGAPRMIATCRAAGLADPVFAEIGSHFRVTFPAVPVRAPQVEPKEQAILSFLGGRKGRTTAEIAEKIKLTTRATRTRLLSMIDRGLIVEIGSGPNDPKKKYHLMQTGLAAPRRG